MKVNTAYWMAPIAGMRTKKPVQSKYQSALLHWMALYAAQKAIGPLQLTEEEAINTARRAYDNNSRLTSFEIGQAIGRSRRTVDRYIADLKAIIHEDLGLNIFRLNLLGIPQERIAQRLHESRKAIRGYLADLVTWPKGPNADLKKGFSVAQVADRQQWPESLVWSIALEGKQDESNRANYKLNDRGIIYRQVAYYRKSADLSAC